MMDTDTTNSHRVLRIVAFNILPFGYRIVSEWAQRHGHDLVLVVTTPGPASRRNSAYRELIAELPARQDVLLTTRMQRVAAHIATLSPDLIVSLTFPYRITPEIRAIPRLGAVNIHPTPLPRYRGPNPPRMIYDAAPTVGATMHWIDDEFDTGRILSVHERAVPDDADLRAILSLWGEAMTAVMEEGAAGAIAGEPGTRQDEKLASYAARFREHERWLDWNASAKTIRRRTFGLMMDPERHSPMAMIAGQPYAVQNVDVLNTHHTPCLPGTVLERHGDIFIIGAADAQVRVTATAIPE